MYYEINDTIKAKLCNVCIAFLSYDEMERRWHDRDSIGRRLIHFGIMFYGKPERFDDAEMIHMD